MSAELPVLQARKEADARAKARLPVIASLEHRVAELQRKRSALISDAAKASAEGRPRPTDFSADLAVIDEELAMAPAHHAAQKKAAVDLDKRAEASSAAYSKAVNAAIVAGPLADARDKVSTALDQLHIALAELAGVHRVAFGEYDPSPFGRDDHPQGPAGELLDQLRRHKWYATRYDIRPSWLRLNYPIPMEAADAAATRAFVERESKA